jgi:hypothetical protein
MSRLRGLIAIGALAMLAGCMNVTYIAKSRPPSAIVHEQKLTFFVGGLVGTEEISAGQLCPGGVAKVHTQHTFVDVLLTVVTLAIYSPRTAEITCAQ